MKMNRLAAISLLAVLGSPLMVLAQETAEHAEAAGAHMPPTMSEGLMTAIVTLIVFVILIVVLTKVAFGPISAGLAARERKIRQDIADAEAARVKAEATLRDYNTQLAKAQDEVKAMLDKASADAQVIGARLKAQAQQDAEEAKERATRDIDASRKAAVTEIHEYAANIGTSIAEKILKREINASDQRDLVQQSLAQLEAVGTKA